ncbi:hypothetical protein FQA39_LY10668 [Lamprigera yunnana]|nr:hypothetical protein FQA39_LY10668 [Lamprigera yunnana]
MNNCEENMVESIIVELYDPENNKSYQLVGKEDISVCNLMMNFIQVCSIMCSKIDNEEDKEGDMLISPADEQKNADS